MSVCLFRELLLPSTGMREVVQKQLEATQFRSSQSGVYFLINSSIINITDIRRSQLLPRKEEDPFNPQLHSFGIRGLTGVVVAGGAGHLSQSTAMDLGVTTSWFSPPFFSTQ